MRRLALALALALALPLLACALALPAGAAPGWQVYMNPRYGTPLSGSRPGRQSAGTSTVVSTQAPSEALLRGDPGWAPGSHLRMRRRISASGSPTGRPKARVRR